MDADTWASPDLSQCLQAAERAISDKNMSAALRYLAVARTLPDAPVEAWLLAAENGAADEAFVLLNEAALRFPHIGRVHHDLARAAERRSDWAFAEHAWRRFVATDPRIWWGYAELAEVLAKLNRLDEAEQVLRQGGQRLPDEAMLTVQLGRLIERRRDWDRAMQIWTEVAERWPDRWEGAVGRSAALLGLGRFAEAHDAAMRAIAGFPQQAQPFHDLARCAEHSEHWPAAEKWWRRFLALEPNTWWGHEGLARALARQKKFSEASVVLETARVTFPAELHLATAYAGLAESEGRLSVALHRWDGVIAQFPAVWNGHRGKAAVLAASGHADAAEVLVAAAAKQFPTDPDALHDVARLAERRGDWAEAERSWRAVLANAGNVGFAFVGLARALVEQRQLDEADATLTQAARCLPDDADIAIEAAQLSDVRGDLSEIVERWRAVSRLQPRSAAGPLGEAAALRRHENYAAADRVVGEALERLPDAAELHDAFILNGFAQEDWRQVETRLQTAEARFPDSDLFRRRRFELQLRVADTGNAAAPASATTQDDSIQAIRALMLEFESLGGGGHGCEFGIFQRHFGAEPLGLLRWADIFQDSLATALEDEFRGVGEPEYTNIFVPPTNDRPEYWTTDKRYHMAMRCFVPADEVPLERMRQQVTKRLGYLRSKLIDDLRDGKKIFVYKNMKANLTEPELYRLHKAVRRYGENHLFYIRYEDAAHPNGTVRFAAPGLLIGYIDHFSHSPDTDVYLGAATDSLLALCQQAHRLVADLRAGSITALAEAAGSPAT